MKEQDMTTDTKAPIRPARQMDAMRKISLAAGVLYLITFAASIPQLKLFSSIINNHDYIRSAGSSTPVLWGSLLELITAAAGIGTAIVLYPVTKRVSPTAAIGFVTSRVVEAALIFVGVLSILTIVTLRKEFSGATGAEADALEITGRALVATRQWTFLLGPGLMAGVNAIFLGSIMYRSRLVPRIIPIVGLIGAPLILASGAATIFGAWNQVSAAGALCGLPVAAWELALGCWLTFKGFRATATSTPVGRVPSDLEPVLVG
jgi:hypothetical protein